MNIYVGNLALSVTQDNLRELFIEFGEVETAKIVTDRFSGVSKGFGFIEMPSNSEADQAIKALNGKFVGRQNIKVRPADPGGKKKKTTKRFQRR